MSRFLEAPRYLFRRLLPAACCLLALALRGQGADDGRRAVDVKRYGITVRVPQAWRLTSWARDNQAFALRVPQDSKTSSGVVQCELGVAPDNLAEFQKREQEAADRPQADAANKRQLLENAVQPLDAAKFGERLARQLGHRQLCVWQIETPAGDRSFEVRVRVVVHGTLYTFMLTTDEAHYEAYRLDFDEMLASAVFTPPETGLERLPGGLWMQRDFRFALRLPPGWKPAFGPSDKVLFFAHGTGHDGLTDNLVVRATVPHPMRLDELKNSLPAEIIKRDEKAQVTCRIVPQGGTFALETKVQTTQGKTNVTTLGAASAARSETTRCSSPARRANSKSWKRSCKKRSTASRNSSTRRPATRPSRRCVPFKGHRWMRFRTCWALLLVTITSHAALDARPLSTADQRAIPSQFQRLVPLHTPLGEPQPGEWLDRHQESGQTYRQYVAGNPVRPAGQRTVIYVQPLGNFTPAQRSVISATAEFLGIYFQLRVQVREDLPLSILSADATRKHPQLGMSQILSTYVLDHVLKPRLPNNAVASIAFTNSDLYPGEGWNFVFGQASLADRVGVWSINRLGDPAESDEAFQRTLLRTLKTGAHETGHMFSMAHCVYYECCMNGSNHLKEANAQPLWLCPQCLAKLCFSTGADPAKRFRELVAFAKAEKDANRRSVLEKIA